MTSRGSLTVARRYANALLAVALEKKADPTTIEGELKQVASLLGRESRLAAALSSPAIAPSKRLGVLDAVLASSEISPHARNFLRLLTTKERLALLPQMVEEFSRLVLEHAQIESGEVFSSHPLTNDQQKKLAESLGQALGKTMHLSYETNPELVGGLVVRIGNRVFDASVTTQLQKFKERALSAL